MKRAYETASETVPEVVKKESKIVHFLATEQNDPEKAAKRLCRYWQNRKDVFGDRWLLPLNLTGFGALTKDDIDFVTAGNSVVLPKGNQGLVLLFDETRLPRLPDKGFVRAMFYLLHVHAERANDLHFVHVVTGAQRNFVNIDSSRWVIFRNAFPMTITQILVAQAYEEGKEHLIDYLGYQTSRLSEMKTKHSAIRISGDSVRATMRLLNDRGLPVECLPTSLGGKYDYGHLKEWIRMRLSVEDAARLPTAATAGSSLLCYRSSAVPQVAMITRPTHRGAILSSSHRFITSSAETPQDRVRELNALYARRSYQKRKLELSSLQAQVQNWKNRNEELRDQNAQLEDLLRRAHICEAYLEAQGNAKKPRLN